MKKYLMMGVAAIALASCSHDMDFYNPDLADQLVVEKYNQAFIENFGVPAPTQTWGFGDVTRGVTRATDTWSETHNHVDGCTGWEGDLNLKSEDEVIAMGAVKLDDANNIITTWDGKKAYKIPSGSVFYISSDFGRENGAELNLSEGFGNGTFSIYNFGNVTGISLNYVNGTITYYNAGTLAFNLSSGKHNFYNGADGNLILHKYDNIGEVYSSGYLELTNADLRSNLKIHSTGAVNFPNGAGSGDGLQSTLDIHGKATVKGDMYIGNANTQYICGLEVSGRLYLNKGHLQTSYIKANEIEFNGDVLYLLPDARVIANTIKMPNSGIYVKGYKGSKALIEVGDIIMQNTCNFEDTFSDNIYFNISGYIDLSGATNIGSKQKKWNSAAEYIEANPSFGTRLNNTEIGGVSECGGPWGSTTTKKLTFLARIFAEDLSASTGSDFDFNDVVFDVYTDGTDAEIEVLAAGGTLPLSVAGVEVHSLFGVGTDVMVNTKAGQYTNAKGEDGKKASRRIPVSGVSTMNDLDKIEVQVQKTNGDGVLGWYKMTAPQGQPASKFAVAKKIGWVRERCPFEDVYGGFKGWVQQDDDARWYENITPGTVDLIGAE